MRDASGKECGCWMGPDDALCPNHGSIGRLRCTCPSGGVSAGCPYHSSTCAGASGGGVVVYGPNGAQAENERRLSALERATERLEALVSGKREKVDAASRAVPDAMGDYSRAEALIFERGGFVPTAKAPHPNGMACGSETCERCRPLAYASLPPCTDSTHRYEIRADVLHGLAGGPITHESKVIGTSNEPPRLGESVATYSKRVEDAKHHIWDADARLSNAPRPSGPIVGLDAMLPPAALPSPTAMLGEAQRHIREARSLMMSAGCHVSQAPLAQVLAELDEARRDAENPACPGRVHGDTRPCLAVMRGDREECLYCHKAMGRGQAQGVIP